MKVVSIILSIIGNTATYVCGILAVAFGFMGAFGILSPITAIVLAAVTVATYILARISNKLVDKYVEPGSLLKAKRAIHSVISHISVPLMIVLTLISFALIIAGITVLIIKDSLLGLNGMGSIIGGIAIIFGIGCVLSLSGKYSDRHCKYCGSSLSGAEFEYEEEERELSISKEGKGSLTSKIRFEFVCPNCGNSNIFRRKMKTDAAKVEKYARSIVK